MLVSFQSFNMRIFFNRAASVRIRSWLKKSSLAFAMLIVMPAQAEKTSILANSLEALERSHSGTYLAGLLAADSHDYEEAAQYYISALVHDWDNVDLIDRAMLLCVAAGDIARGAQLAERLITLEPQNVRARLVYATELIKKQKLVEAQNILVGETQISFDGLAQTIMSAWLAAELEGYQAARAVLDRIEEEDLDDLILLHDGLIAGFVGKTDLSKQILLSAQAQSPNLLRATLAAAHALQFPQDQLIATSMLQFYIDDNADHPRVRHLLEKLKTNTPFGPYVQDVAGGASEVLGEIGTALTRNRNSDVGIMMLQLSLYLNQEADLVSVSLASAFEDLQELQRAIKVYQAVSEQSPLKKASEIRMAFALADLDRTDDAANTLIALIDASPDDVELMGALGNVYRSARQHEKAIAAYSRALDDETLREKADWRLYFGRGVSYEQTQQWPKAEADFLASLALEENQPQVLNYLGYSWIDRGLYLQRALDMIQRAVDLRPDDGFIIDSLGWVYYRLGDYERALTLLEQAVNLVPHDPVLNDHLGDVYWKVGRKLEATFQWAHARDLGAEGEDRERILKKLEVGLTPELESGVKVATETADAP